VSDRNELEFNVRHALAKLESNGDIWPGSVERLVTLITPHVVEPSAAYSTVLTFIYGTPGGRKNLTDPAAEFGSGAASLRRVIAMSPCHPDRREIVYRSLASKVGASDYAVQAQAVADHLESRAGRADHASPPPPPYPERRVRSMLDRFRVKPTVDLDGLAASWAGASLGLSDGDLASMIASRLATRGMCENSEETFATAGDIAADSRRNPRVNLADVERLSAAYGQAL
jgi:hypothetical protein